MKPSRTYELRLSDQGIDLFLACHCRLTRLSRLFLPYGATLSVVVAVLERLSAAEIAAEFEAQRCQRAAGSTGRFVGAPSSLATHISEMAAKLSDSPEFGSPPRAAPLYLVGLCAFSTLDDAQLLAVFQQMMERQPGR